jgi:hypothetical protein
MTELQRGAHNGTSSQPGPQDGHWQLAISLLNHLAGSQPRTWPGRGRGEAGRAGGRRRCHSLSTGSPGSHHEDQTAGIAYLAVRDAGTVSMARRIGRWRTAYLALSGLPIDVPAALDWGLVDEIAG